MTSQHAAPTSERRVVSVLFADIAGFTAIAERLDPEIVTDAVNAIFAALGDEVEAVGGYVDKVIGDNIMAVFGAPVTHEDDSLRAVRAALAMQRAVEARQVSLQQMLGQPVRLRIGIHSGQVVWGVVGPPGQTRPTVMGDVVNLASRLQRAAPEGGVLVSHAVWRQVRGAFDTRVWTPIEIKGKSEPVAVYEIVGERTGAEPMAQARFVDRTEDVGQLRDLFARARKGRAQVAIVTGDAGIGKTRLAEEFVTALPDDAAILRTACPPYGGQSLGPLSDLFVQFAGLSRPISLSDVEAKVPPGERAHQAALILSRLFNLVAVDETVDVSHETALLVAADAIRRMLVRPTVIWIEDLQWADAGTREVLPFIVERLGDAPLLLIGTLRTGEAPPAWGRRTSVSTLALDPLTDDDAADLLDALLDGPLSDPSRHALITKAGGNPFYLSEIVTTLRSRGTLVLDGNGDWRLTGQVEGVLPDTVQAAVLARLDRLAPDLRMIVQRAAAVGTAFTRTLIGALNPDIDVNDGLLQLEDAGFVRRRDPLAPDPEYVFMHPLLREVAYASLLGKHQTALHGQIAEALGRLYPGQRDELAKAIGTHFAEAGDAAQALPYLVQAGEQAARRYATREAIHLLEKAQRLSEQVGQEVAALTAAEMLGDLYLRVQDRGVKDWFAVWEFVRSHVDRAQDPLRWVRASVRAAHAAASDYRVSEAMAFLDEAAPLIPAGHALLSDLLRVRAQTHVLRSEYRPALEAARQAVEIAGRVGTMEDRSRAHAVLAHPALLPLLGEDGRRMMQAWVAEVAATGDERLLIEARHFLVSDIWTRGVVDLDLLHTIEEALGKAVAFGWTRDEAILSMLFGWACFLTGRWPEAQARLQHAHVLMEDAGGRQHYLYEILLPHLRANMAMVAGRLGDAQAIFEGALVNAPFHSPIWLNHDLARCLLMQGNVSAARAAMARALAAHDRFRCIVCGCQANGVAAEFFATLGEIHEAESRAREAEETAVSIGHVTTRMRAARALARVAVSRGAPEEAIGIARGALSVAAALPLEQPFEAALTQWVLGDAHHAAGDGHAAHAAWNDAREAFASLGAQWHLQQVDVLLSRASD